MESGEEEKEGEEGESSKRWGRGGGVHLVAQAGLVEEQPAVGFCHLIHHRRDRCYHQRESDRYHSHEREAANRQQVACAT